jgi:alpha-1,3-glucosyltransferase
MPVTHHSPLCEVGIDLVANKMAPWGWALLGLAMLLYRYCIGLWPHSGEGDPPMYGDYEAQRHWMEVTTALPVGDWYRHTAQNDLQYWGLDYPPLTAFASYACGRVGLLVEPAAMALGTSRGHETPASRTFMRLTVIFVDLVIYFPACYLVVWSYYGHRARRRSLTWPRRYEAVGLLLVQPALLLIDHGHFQYNQVSLGFMLLAVAAFGRHRYYLTAIMFCGALNFKQISLFYALAFFFTLLSSSIHSAPRGFGHAARRVMCLGAVVVVVFALHFLPFCVWSAPGETCAQGMGHVLSRVFPFNRGLFEDKVSNVWCVLDPVLKLRRVFAGNTGALKAMSAGATLLLCTPSIVALLRTAPSVRSLVYALTSTSLAFFLCGFQVHEKSILFPVASASVLILEEPRVVTMFVMTATFSMFPLLSRDGLVVPYMVTMLAFFGFAWGIVPVSPLVESLSLSSTSPSTKDMPDHAARSNANTPVSSPAAFGSPSTQRTPRVAGMGGDGEINHSAVSTVSKSVVFQAYVKGSFLAMVVLHALPIVMSPPKRYPDLFVLLLCAYCCGQFLLAWGYCTWRLWSISSQVGERVWVPMPRIRSHSHLESMKRKKV